jgi:hypothetical protein
MGCDIHTHIEIKVNGTWEHWACPDIRRWYELFEFLAGVRGEVEKAIVPPKGFPSDASVLTKMDYDYYGADAHTPSWLGWKELDKLSAWLENYAKENSKEKNARLLEYNLEFGILRGTYLFGNGLTSFKHYNDVEDVEYVPKSVTDVRMVFWFDN